MQLRFYVQAQHSLRPHLAKIILRVYPDSSTLAARTGPKDFSTVQVRRLICKSVTLAVFAEKRDVICKAGRTRTGNAGRLNRRQIKKE